MNIGQTPCLVEAMCLIKLFAFRVRGGETKPPRVLRLVEVI